MGTPGLLKGAIIGFGVAGAHGHGPEYLRRRQEAQDIEIVAIADISPERLQLAQARFPGVQVYSDPDILLEREARHLHFVDICTPPIDHFPLGHKALRMGLHVLCESPLGFTGEDISILVDRAHQENKVLFPYVPLRHSPVLEGVRQACDSRLIGRIRSSSLHLLSEGVRVGAPEWKPLWRQDMGLGGGIVFESGLAAIQLTLDWMGSPPSHVSAKSFPQGPESVPDFFQAQLTFPSGVSQIMVSTKAGVRKFLHLIHGESGAFTLQDDTLEIAVLQKAHRSATDLLDLHWTTEKKLLPSRHDEPGHTQWFANGLDRFVSLVRDGTIQSKELAHAKRAVLVAIQCLKSAKEGCREIFLEPGMV